MNGNFLFTSESVSEGHPDKVADRISDAITDAILARDPLGRAAIEVLVTKRLCVIAGETSEPGMDAAAIARRAIRSIGYEDDAFGADSTEVRVALQEQAREIGAAVDAKGEEGEGAGDQGLMFGYACDETDELMPAPILYAHRVLEYLAAWRRRHPGVLGPDAKSQLTVEYRDGRPSRIHTAVVSHQHAPGVEVEEIVRTALREVLPSKWLDDRTRVLVNPSGSFVSGGPAADTGLTGRKIIVDTYGGAAPHGGGAFSGKDPTKVDRSAAYAARHLAKNVVAAGLAGRCVIQLAYAIGVAEPLALYVETFGTGRVPDGLLAERLRQAVPLTPKAIIERLQLRRPIYEPTAAYGHFGRKPDGDLFGWERLDLVETLRSLS
ncbi:methionine adenosyltransferase [Vulgatibacter incomptus]|uniref:Methionine adenosyltransferase n=1 Tax=Vulgatibacter incomptus TaxID=1391653 RepID=A0A0K1PGH2_9BACT|nr:methionine adenosyltransferase [Vulgatibacter incomptus]AKU92638.1 S-adenosylmethionine synthetase [Vulgatibacter incomptus]